MFDKIVNIVTALEAFIDTDARQLRELLAAQFLGPLDDAWRAT